MARLFNASGRTSVGYRDQSDLVTAAATGSDTDWSWLNCELPWDKVTLGRDLENFLRTRGVPGGTAPPLVGGKHGGEFTIRAPLDSQLTAYDYTSDTAAFSPLGALLKEVLGTGYTLTYDAGDVTTASTTTQLNTTAGTYEIGALMAFGASGAVRGMGFSSTQSTQAITHTLAASAGVSGDDVLSTVTAALTNAQPTPKTFRLTGDDTAFDLRLIGAMPSGAKLMLHSRKVPVIEITYRYTSWSWDSGAAGGLKDLTDYSTVPAIIGDNGGYMTQDGAEVCGLGPLEIDIELVHDEIECPSALEGVKEILVSERNATVRFNYPIASGDLASNELAWVTKFEANTGFALTLVVGNTAGALLGFHAPQLVVSAQPQPVIIGGRMVGLSIEAKPNEYTGDTVGDGTSAAEDTNLRIAFG